MGAVNIRIEEVVSANNSGAFDNAPYSPHSTPLSKRAKHQFCIEVLSFGEDY